MPEASRSDSYRLGRRVSELSSDPAMGRATAVEAPTWRGWALGVLGVVFISLTIPYADFVLRGTLFSNNMFPASSIVLLFVLVALVGFTLGKFRTALGLRRADLILVFCMTMLVTALPGNGFWAFWVSQVTGGAFYDSPENRYGDLVLPNVPAEWAPHDTEEARPVEWFYTGLPKGGAIPWRPWIGPYLRWSLALLMMFGMLFALSSLLRRQWSDREQLAFPLAQLPEDMVHGLYEGGGFLSSGMARWGIGAAFVFHAWNNLADYVPNLPEIPRGSSFYQYLSEPPWNGLLPVWMYIYLSVIGLTYLLPLEVSFSLWFYFILQRVLSFFSINYGLLPQGGRYWDGPFVESGTGAMYALALAACWMARRELGGSLKAALGLVAAEHDPHEVHPRWLWLLLAGCALGSVAWMVAYGISPVWAVALLVLMLLAMLGLARLSCEGGMFFMQNSIFPTQILQAVAPPHLLGASNYVKLHVWNRTMVADWFRVVFMPVILNALHLASRTGLRLRSALGGMVLAVVVSLAVSFFAFLYTAYHTPGGAQQMTWRFTSHPKSEYAEMAAAVSKIQAYDQKLEEYGKRGAAVPREEIPDVARADGSRIFWCSFGAAFMLLSLFLRTVFFWFPHPIGVATWMGPYPSLHLWFSFFLGWAIKGAILKYGGSRVYLTWKRFFIGLVVGEGLATIFWKVVAAGAHNVDGYNMLPG
ncbi:MAG: hypothetical protein M5U26_08195 [Planctomycetota bacterium]|nr:hypothetical protein [Planctomycetota bacterium]